MNKESTNPSDLDREALIKHMVSRFLAWKLPENFNPDAGISFKRDYNENSPWPMKHEPMGTNLFDAVQAEAMVRHLLDGAALPRASGVPEAEAVAAAKRAAKDVWFADGSESDQIEAAIAAYVAARTSEPNVSDVVAWRYKLKGGNAWNYTPAPWPKDWGDNIWSREPLYAAQPPANTGNVIYAAPGGGYYSTRWEFEEAWREHKTKDTSPPPIAAPSGEALEPNELAAICNDFDKLAHDMAHELSKLSTPQSETQINVLVWRWAALGRRRHAAIQALATPPSPIASEPKDAGSGEGQEMTRDEQERAITFLRTMGYLDGDRSSNQWLAAFHTAGYRIAPSGAKS